VKFDSKFFASNRLVFALPQGNPKNVRVFDSFVPRSGQTSFAMCAEEAPCGGPPAPKAVRQDVKETLAKLTSVEVDSAVVSGSPESKRFYDYVFSEPARKVLTDAGFELP
jgi:molybdate transport system substrate-binding protein